MFCMTLYKVSRSAVAVVWFRRDLRLADNPALTEALVNHDQVLPVYIQTAESAPWDAGAASNWWLHHALDDLRRALSGRLLLRLGPALETLRDLIAETGADFVYMPNDVAFNAGPFVSPQDFAEIVEPYWRRQVERTHEHGMIAFIHTDGQIMPILDSLVAQLRRRHPARRRQCQRPFCNQTPHRFPCRCHGHAVCLADAAKRQGLAGLHGPLHDPGTQGAINPVVGNWRGIGGTLVRDHGGNCDHKASDVKTRVSSQIDSGAGRCLHDATMPEAPDSRRRSA